MVETESTPLLRSNHTKSTFGVRIFSYAIIGLALLGIYELIFLARTSTSRDWNHLHNSKFTLDTLRREIVHRVSNDTISKYSDHYYLGGPHLAGQNYELAEYTRAQLEKFGFETKIKTYDVLLNYPVDHSAALVNGTEVVYQLSLEEDVIEEDPTTGDKNRIPTFHGYSASGNATGQLIYANYGRKRDYDLLVAKGVDFTGKVVLVRYGGLFRGLKVKFAEQLGAAAVLIYSDPKDDGEVTAKNGYRTYPEGPARNPSSVQRGSVQDLSFSPGDPTTPGYASKPGAPREEPHGIPGIPSIPISYVDALPLLKALNGHGPKISGWEGGLDDVDYSVGPSELEANVYSEQDYAIRAIYNVIAKIKGVQKQEVIVGNHRDAWVLGAADPNSGSSVLLEIGRVLGGLAKEGWKPYRTIILASWDAEEYGLVGSTEWGEDHEKHLNNKALAYLNTDVASSGPALEVSASPLLHESLYEVAKLTPGPVDKESSLYDYWVQQDGAHIASLGSGSDYTVFQDHLGIASVDLGFTANGSSNVYHYHSNYDSLHWQKTYGDTTFEQHATVARVIGLLVAQLTDNAVIPFRTSAYAELLHTTVNKYLEDQDKDDEPIAELLSVAEDLLATTAKFDAYVEKLTKEYTKDYPWYKFIHKFLLLVKIKIANIKLFFFERTFVYEEGLDDRNWFKHIVFAPGRYTGYAGQVLPGLIEALEDQDWEKLYRWVDIVQDKLNAANTLIAG